MFDSIRNWFPCKARSLDDFVKILKKEGCCEVVAEQQRVIENGVMTATVGIIGRHRYMLVFRTTTPKGRLITYTRLLQEEHGSTYGVADAESRLKSAVTFYLCAEKILQELQSRLPGVSIKLMGPQNQVMDAELFKTLHRDAATLNIAI